MLHSKSGKLILDDQIVYQIVWQETVYSEHVSMYTKTVHSDVASAGLYMLFCLY